MQSTRPPQDFTNSTTDSLPATPPSFPTRMSSSDSSLSLSSSSSSPRSSFSSTAPLSPEIKLETPIAKKLAATLLQDFMTLANLLCETKSQNSPACQAIANDLSNLNKLSSQDCRLVTDIALLKKGTKATLEKEFEAAQKAFNEAVEAARAGGHKNPLLAGEAEKRELALKSVKNSLATVIESSQVEDAAKLIGFISGNVRTIQKNGTEMTQIFFLVNKVFAFINTSVKSKYKEPLKALYLALTSLSQLGFASLNQLEEADGHEGTLAGVPRAIIKNIDHPVLLKKATTDEAILNIINEIKKNVALLKEAVMVEKKFKAEREKASAQAQQLFSLSTKVNNLNAAIEEQTATIDKLVDKLSDEHANAIRLAAKNQEKSETLSKVIEGQGNDISRLTAQLDEAIEHSDAERKRSVELLEQHNLAEMRLRENAAEIEKLQRQVRDQCTSIDIIRKLNTELKHQHGDLETKIHVLTVQGTSLSADLNEAKAQEASLQSHLNSELALTKDINALLMRERHKNASIAAINVKLETKNVALNAALPTKELNTWAPTLGLFGSLSGVSAGIYLAMAATIPVIGWAVLIGAAAIALGVSAYYLAKNRSNNSFFKAKDNITPQLNVAQPVPSSPTATH